MTFTTDWPVRKPRPKVDSRAGAQSAKLALAKRMESLACVPLFAGLSKRQLQTLGRACSSHQWPAGALIVAEGSSDQYFYVVVDGTVDVDRGGRTVARLGRGDFFGEIALLDPGPRSATVRTASEVVAVGLTRRGFLDVAMGNPQISLRMLAALARRIRETTEKITY